MPFYKDDYHERETFSFTKYFKNLFGLKITEEYNENIFEHAGVFWQGNPDETVDNNPMCTLCLTQLSFINKDMVICEKCHKNGDNIGDFKFKLKGIPVSYVKAYEDAKKRWLDIMKSE